MINLVYKVGGEKHCRPIKSLEEFTFACNTEENIRNWENYRRTLEDKYKHALVQVNYNCQVAEGGLLKGVKTVSPFFFYDIDCANQEECRCIISKLLEMKDELGLVEVAESASYGVHAVARRMPGKTILESQVRMSIHTQTEMDTNNKENNRVVFHGPINAETTPLIDEALFSESLSDEEAATEYLRLKKREAQGLEEVPPGAKKANKHYKPWEEKNVQKPQTSELSHQTSKTFPDNYHGIPFTDIIAKYWEVNNRGFEPTQGDRDTLTYQLACDLRHICGRNFEWLDQVIPCYDGFPVEEKREKIKNALSSEFNGFPSRLRNTLNALASTDLSKEERGERREEREDDEEEEKLSILNSQLSINSLPPIFKEFTDAAPEDFKVPTVMALLPVMGTLMSGLRAEYLDGEEHAPNFITVVEAPQASGKSFTRKLVDECMKSVREYDVQERAKEKEYNDALKRAKNAKEQPQDPKALIRMVPASISIAKLLKRLACSGGLHLFTFLEELDTLTKSNRAGAWSQKSDIYRNAFDNAMYGQDFMSDNSYSDIVPVFYNMLLCGTPNAVGRFFNDPEDGLVSRVMFVQLPDQFGAEIPRWKKVPSAQLQKIERLCREMDKSLCVSEEGKRQEPKEIDLGYVNAPLKRWLEEQRMESLKNVDYARDTFRRRSAVMGFRAAMIAHWLWGEPKDKKRRERVIHFALFVADYVLRQQIVKYGNRLEEIRNKQILGISGRKTRSMTIFEELKDKFNRAELQALMGKYEMSTPIKVMLSIWKRNGMIETDKKYSSDIFYKTPSKK